MSPCRVPTLTHPTSIWVAPMILLLFSHEVINPLAGSCQSRGNRTPPGANRHAAHDSSCVKIAGAMSSSTGVENRLKLASAVSPGSAQVSGRGWRAIP